MEEIESQQLKLERTILDLSLERLTVLATHLEVNVDGDGRLTVLRNVRRKVEENVESAEDKLTVVNQIIEFIGSLYTEQLEQDKEITEYVKAREELERMREEFNKTMELQKKQIEEATAKLSTLKEKEPIQESTLHGTVSTNSTPNVDSVSVFRREFKIMGSIGGEKDKLSYVGLMRQIDSGLAKGYKEPEIIDAVIRCINSNSKLKSYLEIMKDITLQKLCQILRVHYQEKTATELYQELTTVVQGPKESPQDFLLRALSLRERIVFASKDDETGMKYDAILVKSLFTHAFETGLREEIIRSKIRNVLHKEGFSDEELMESLNKIVSVEEERQTKLRASQSKNAKEFRVNSVNTTGNDDDMASTASKPAKTKDSSLLTTLAALQAQVADLNAKFENSRRETNSAANTTRYRRKCQSCHNNNIAQCDHCFKCGSTDHMARGCKSSSGNGRMLPPRDRK